MDTHEVPTTQHERKLVRRKAECNRHDSVRVMCTQYPDGYPLGPQAPIVWGYRYAYRVRIRGHWPAKRRYISVGRAWLDAVLRNGGLPLC